MWYLQVQLSNPLSAHSRPWSLQTDVLVHLLQARSVQVERAAHKQQVLMHRLLPRPSVHSCSVVRIKACQAYKAYKADKARVGAAQTVSSA
jgi:hypothetical protein